jgi:thioredoxin-dependent peroxiredoxin
MSLVRLALGCNLLAILFIVGEARSAEPTASGTKSKPSSPRVGEKAPDFSLDSVRGSKVELSKLAKNGPVALVVLRGYPGYQCPICNQQVGGLLSAAGDFKKAMAQVVLVYPGPSGALKERAKEFIADRTIPEHFHLVLDPDYSFTTAYGLRWDAPRETAYPSTFIIDSDQKIRFAHVSKTHGDRTNAKTVLKELVASSAAKRDQQSRN